WLAVVFRTLCGEITEAMNSIPLSFAFGVFALYAYLHISLQAPNWAWSGLFRTEAVKRRMIHSRYMSYLFFLFIAAALLFLSLKIGAIRLNREIYPELFFAFLIFCMSSSVFIASLYGSDIAFPSWYLRHIHDP